MDEQEFNRVDVMVDLETLGVNPDCVVLSIGACSFKPYTGDILNTFYAIISKEFQDIRTKTPGTVDWWKGQNTEAKEVLRQDIDRIPFDKALIGLTALFEQSTKIWGNGAHFDISILENFCRQVALPYPWNHWNVRDVRTIVDLASHLIKKYDFEFKGEAHNALDDAIHQAKYVSKMWQALKNIDHTRLMTEIFNLGYLRGHHETVEGCYTDILEPDMRFYHDDIVKDLIEAITKTNKN